ncbi:MAG: hypothetical protein SGPRY_002742, partial [Prymnesium sp.]
SEACVEWFARGWGWLGGYHREEAAWCFSQAVRSDPSCALAHCALALSHGPDYNFHGGNGFYELAAQPSGWPSLPLAREALRTARSLPAEEWERGLIDALSARYELTVRGEEGRNGEEGKESREEGESGKGTVERMNREYARRMEALSSTYPLNPHIAAVAAEAVLVLRPWDVYVKPSPSSTPPWDASDKRMREEGERALCLIDRGLAAAPSDAWLCHLKIHLSEMGPVDAFDWRAADEVGGKARAGGVADVSCGGGGEGKGVGGYKGRGGRDGWRVGRYVGGW